MNKHHGIAYGLKNQEEGLEFYTCYTLFDITNTGIIMPYNDNIEAGFMDTADQPIFNEKSWERSRNQQRNWDTMVQIISMRAQPIVLQSAKVFEEDLSNYRFGEEFSGVQKVWVFRFGIEAKDAYRRGSDQTALLYEDSNLVPLTNGLTEKVVINPPCVITSGSACNTYFEYGYKP